MCKFRKLENRVRFPDMAPSLVIILIFICTMADTNYLSIADVIGYELKNVTVDPRTEGIDPSKIDDVLKLSHAQNILVDTVTVNAGGLQRENAIDMNRVCVNVMVKDCILYSGKQNAITIKGGCRDVTIQNVQIVPGEGHCDIELGNWSDQSQDYVLNVNLINVTRTDGAPVRLRIGHAKNVIVEGGNVKENKLGSLMVKLYFFFKGLFK